MNEHSAALLLLLAYGRTYRALFIGVPQGCECSKIKARNLEFINNTK